MINKRRNLRSSILMFIIFVISLLIMLFAFKGLRIVSFLFLMIIFTLSFSLSNMIDFKKNIYSGFVGLAIGFLITLVWLIVNSYLSVHLGIRVTFNIATAYLATPLITFYSLIGFLGGIIPCWSKKKLKLNSILKIVIILLLIFFITFTIRKDQYLLNQYNTKGIFCDEFIINYVGDPERGAGEMYLTLFGSIIPKDECKMRDWSSIVEKFPDLGLMEEAIINKDPDRCTTIENKDLILTKDHMFRKPVRSLVYSNSNLKSIYDQCIYAVTLVSKDEKPCNKLSKEKLKEDCYFDIAMLNSNMILCEKTSNKRGHFDFGSFRDLCYRDVNKIHYPKGYFDKEDETILTNGTLEFFDKTN